MTIATDAHDATDAALVRQAAQGSEFAFRTLYRAYVKPVYWVAYSLLGDATEAEDATQETFVVAWRKLGGFELIGEHASAAAGMDLVIVVGRTHRTREPALLALAQVLPPDKFLGVVLVGS